MNYPFNFSFDLFLINYLFNNITKFINLPVYYIVGFGFLE